MEIRVAENSASNFGQESTIFKLIWNVGGRKKRDAVWQTVRKRKTRRCLFFLIYNAFGKVSTTLERKVRGVSEKAREDEIKKYDLNPFRQSRSCVVRITKRYAYYAKCSFETVTRQAHINGFTFL